MAAQDAAPGGGDLACGALLEGEQVHLEFKGIRDSVVFMDKRLISINVQAPVTERPLGAVASRTGGAQASRVQCRCGACRTRSGAESGRPSPWPRARRN